MITISTPAKIHLMGEHAVVYGKPALLSAINLRIKLNIFPSQKTPQLEGNALVLKDTIENLIKQRFKIKKIPTYDIKIDSQIPMGSGLGSSAAISASFVAALLSFLKIDWDLNLVNTLAYEGEKIFHGNPAGADNSTVVFGGLLFYRKEFEFLKSITRLDLAVDPKIKPFFLINSGDSTETTKQMVEKVKLKKDKAPKLIEEIFADQEQQTKNLVWGLKDGDEKLVIKTIQNGQKNLEKLGVVGKKAQAIIRQIETIGGAAKISGGGGYKTGSGLLVCYHPTPEKLKKLATKNHWEIIKIQLGEEGLKRES